MSFHDNYSNERQVHILPNVIEHDLTAEHLPNNLLRQELQAKNNSIILEKSSSYRENVEEIFDQTTDNNQINLRNSMQDVSTPCYNENRRNARRLNVSLTAFGHTSHYKPNLNDYWRPKTSRRGECSNNGQGSSGYNTNRHNNSHRLGNRNVSVATLGHSHFSSHHNSERLNMTPENSIYGPSTSGYTGGHIIYNQQWGVRRNRRVHRNADKFLIPRAPFSRAVKDILDDFNTNTTRMTRGAMETFQEDCENFFTDFFSDCYLATMHAKRVTLMPSDMALIRRVKGRTFLVN